MKAVVSIVTFFLPIVAEAKGVKESAIIPVLYFIVGGLLLVTFAVLSIVLRVRTLLKRKSPALKPFEDYLGELDATQVNSLLKARASRVKALLRKANLILIALLTPGALAAQALEEEPRMFTQPGVVITVILVAVPLLLALILMITKINRMLNRYYEKEREVEAQRLADYLVHLDGEEIEHSLVRKKSSLEHSLTNLELSGILRPDDRKGLIQSASSDPEITFVAPKKKAMKRPNIEPRLSAMILWYLGTAVFWLVFGTSVGEYLGIKFLAPDIDHQSWLSFGRLRPVHTNAVFWGWSSLAMLGLGYYVVPTVSNRPIASLKKGWLALWLINASVLCGSLCLMSGINNGGGEYREYIWPVMLLFGAGLALTLVNFLQTIASRATREVYISNWYIVSAIIFTIVISFVAYWPTWQNGLGETIVQGYWMHQGVGMWFMLFTLGIVYYFLPQQLNKPIYSYSLGILAFWTQILFYTVIGTHHFVFSSIPWSLQTIAIVGSMGMVIPVIAGTTNFLMTFKGDFHRVGSSYTLPFFLVGIVFYFTGSFQGTAEAFRYTNLLWHFTDFTVAHSHITMYGIIAFFLWGSIYAIVPRLTGNEPRQAMVGAHFWLAFVGLLQYSVPLMIGGTLRGMMWMDAKPFMESVTMMAPYWLWRAIGGSMMWAAHLIFAWNFYQMIQRMRTSEVRELALLKIKALAEENRAAAAVN